MRDRKRIEALAIGWVAIDNDGIRHYASLVTSTHRLRACDERPVREVEKPPSDLNITCLLCASKELP